jgi:cyclomaltodextrinase
VRPEFGSPPAQLDERGVEIWSLHQYLIGLRRRHPWLYAASTSALQLENRQYVYQTRHGDEALIVALNIDETPLRVRLKHGPTEVIAGSGAPPPEVVDSVTVEPHGWRILQPVHASR